MINVNSFRFGQISRKQAGRFLEDGYNNGSFTFSNAVTMFDGGMSRRPPLSTVISLPEDYSWYRIHAFSFSDLVEDSYIIAFGCKQNGNTFENISKIYRRNAEGSFEQNTEIKQVIKGQANDSKEKEHRTIKNTKKVGRNDPCTCGSGKKYKQCCGK